MMSDKSVPAPPAALPRIAIQRGDQPALVDEGKLGEFIALLGPARARLWLGGFCAEMTAAFSGPVGSLPTETSRANIHNFCARAGLTGFDALHHACLDFLEAGPGPGDSVAAYHRVRAQADLACLEIDRRCAEPG